MAKVTKKKFIKTANGLSIGSLARKLAMNYYNVSIASKNPELKKKSTKRDHFAPDTDIIFNDKIPHDKWRFERNILILGAGASYDSFDFVGAGEKIIKEINQFLKIEERYTDKTNKHFNEKTRELASIYLKKVYDSDTNWKIIESELGFEGGLTLLLNFYPKHAILNEFKKHLGYKYLPSYLYEIISHMFKHRFFDAIINFNFDEILDNALEDEMGDGNYFKIVTDADWQPLSKIMDENRLRVPLYIKPHGSISQKTSILFTNEHYIINNSEINQLINDLFLGKVQDNHNNNIKHINIIMAGYSLSDIDLHSILFKQIEDTKVESINYFIIKGDPKSTIDTFKKRFLDHILSKAKVLFPNEKTKIKNYLEQNRKTMETKCTFHGIICEKTISSPLTSVFENIWNQIDKEFKEPFKPVGLARHKLINYLFPKSKVVENQSAFNDKSLSQFQDYVITRAAANTIYDLCKFNFNVPINIIDKERSGKYYNLYLDSVKNNFNQVMEFTQILSKKFNINLEIKNNHYRINSSNGSSDINLVPIVESLLSNSFVKGVSDPALLKVTEKNVFELLKNSQNKPSYEINANFYDSKHKRFAPFMPKQVMLTNLSLTWHFYNFAVNNLQSWKYLYFSDDSPKTIFNLHDYADKKPCHLLPILKDKHLKVIYLHDKTIHSSLFKKQMQICDFLNEYRKNNFCNGELVLKQVKAEMNYHMALFLDEDKKPIFGIYIFKPSTKNRINPVYFMHTKNETNDNVNLKRMLELWNEMERD